VSADEIIGGIALFVLICLMIGGAGGGFDNWSDNP